MPKNPAWLKSAIFYEIYPQSFADSNGDGIGDLKGLIKKLDYVKSLGCDAIWLNPCFVSPFQDAGYDVSDYYKIAPRYGTNADARRLFQEAKKRGIRVCLDLVAGHTSIEHPWFKASCSAKPNKYSDWYIWTDNVWGQPGQGIETVRGWGERDGSYMTNFFYSQPALNYGFAKPNPKLKWQQRMNASAPKQVGNAMLKIMRFWLKMGAMGFRVDLAGSLVKVDKNQKETIKLWKKLSNAIKREFPEMVLISEWGQPDRALTAGFDIDFMLHFPTPAYSSLFRWGKDSYFHRRSGKSAKQFLDEFLSLRRKTAGKGYIAVPSGNHDMDRLGYGRDAEDMKVAFAFLLTLPGQPFIYYGDEIGMDKIEGLPSKEGGYNRTGSRTPMQWSKGKNRGFSNGSPAKLYLPVDKRSSAPTVESQDGKPGSLLETVRALNTLRRNEKLLQADAGFKVLHDGSKGAPLVYARSKGRDRVIVVIQPKAKAKHWASKGQRISGLEVLVEQGIDTSLNKGQLTVSSKGPGFGIYRVLR